MADGHNRFTNYGSTDLSYSAAPRTLANYQPYCGWGRREREGGGVLCCYFGVYFLCNEFNFLPIRKM